MTRDDNTLWTKDRILRAYNSAPMLGVPACGELRSALNEILTLRGLVENYQLDEKARRREGNMLIECAHDATAELEVLKLKMERQRPVVEEAVKATLTGEYTGLHHAVEAYALDSTERAETIAEQEKRHAEVNRRMLAEEMDRLPNRRRAAPAPSHGPRS